MAIHIDVGGAACGEPNAQLTGDVNECTCQACCWRLVSIAHGQLGAALRRLNQIVTKVDVIATKQPVKR